MQSMTHLMQNRGLSGNPWDDKGRNSQAAGCGVIDYTNGAGRYNPTASGIEGGIFGGAPEPKVDPRAAAAASRAKAVSGDFLDRLAAAEARDGASNPYNKEICAGMRPSLKPSKHEVNEALTKRQTTLRAAEQRVRENQQEVQQERVMNAAKRQYQNTPQAFAIEQAEMQLDQRNAQQHRHQQRQDAQDRVQMQLAEHNAMQQEQRQVQMQRQRQMEARRAHDQREQHKQMERQQYQQQMEQRWQPNYLQGRQGTPMAGPNGHEMMHAGQNRPPSARRQQQQPQQQQMARASTPQRMAAGGARGASPRAASPRSSTKVIRPPGGKSSIMLG